MTTPTNWPNPERPGVPMFPERDGWHWLKGPFALGFEVHHWVASQSYDGSWIQEWESKTGNFSPDLFASYEYHGPVLTPTQIAEMLAGERERFRNDALTKVNDTPTAMEFGSASGGVVKALILGTIRSLGAAS